METSPKPRDLPTGIVTFLFTDIEGSTRLLERLGERYLDVQQRHDGIVRAAITEGGGVEVSTEGDAFFAVFSSPTDAILAAVHAQRELAAAAWPSPDEVRVRMGLNTGQGTLGGANYLGLDVNRTARIAAAAHGGQVLLSDATRALVERSLASGTQLRDLGQHRLKDLLQPERLHQVVIEGLKQDFPPPRTLDARPNNLPPQLTRFIGRVTDINALREILAASRLVTLTGPGGTGKTRLGLQVAAEALADFRDGAFFVDLSAVTDVDLVAQEIAAALEVRQETGHDAIDTLTSHLRAKELLLVLDNFEQVVDAGPLVLEPLLREAAGVRALVTSRLPLHVYGEHEYPVPPLGLPDSDRLPAFEALVQLEAVALFAERAAASRPGFRVTPQNARTVAEITMRLDGLPLAIELAASRVKLLSPADLLARLEKRLPLLTAQDRNVPERQRTLRQTIEWSYELLDDPERVMFARLAVFAGGANIGAVEVVVNPEGALGLATLDGLGSLVDKNLLRAVETSEGERRFAMLETIREYGLERLTASGEESVIRRSHAERWIEVAERSSEALNGAEQTESARGLERDHDNFRAALAWAVQTAEADVGLRLGAALRDFWRVGNHFREGVRWLDSLLALPDAAERAPLRARALTAAADLSSWMGETEGYLRRAEAAIAIYRSLEDASGIADSLQEVGVAQLTMGQFEAAEATLQEARQLSLDLGDRTRAASATAALGMLALMTGRTDASRALLEEGLTTFTELQDPFWTAFLERLLGGLDRLEGNLVAAEKRFRASLSAALQHDLPMVVATNLYAFADLALVRGQHERALRLVGAHDAVRDQVGEATPMERAMMGDVGSAARALVDEASAERAYQDGRELELNDAVAYALQQEEA